MAKNNGEKFFAIFAIMAKMATKSIAKMARKSIARMAKIDGENIFHNSRHFRHGQKVINGEWR